MEKTFATFESANGRVVIQSIVEYLAHGIIKFIGHDDQTYLARENEIKIVEGRTLSI